MDELTKQAAGINIHGSDLSHSETGSIKTELADNGPMPDTENEILRDLRITDPRTDRDRIIRQKGGLFRDSSQWILDDPMFQKWRDGDENDLLWLKGGPGKGKTMLACEVIDDLRKSTKSDRCLSYYFCRADDALLNNADAVLRGLLYLLLNQQRHLLVHVKEQYAHAGRQLFDDKNGWDALHKIFIDCLHDPKLRDCWFVIDGLDECKTNQDLLLDLINDIHNASRAKILVSSRDWPPIQRKLRDIPSRLQINLEENSRQVSNAVDVYINHVTSKLDFQGELYLQERICKEMKQKANGTFLWVALIARELEKVDSWDMMEVIREAPRGLNALYHRMMGHIQDLRRDNTRYCYKLLATVVTAYRPLHLQELQVLVDLPSNIVGKQSSVAQIAAKCGSFLTIHNDVVSIIHQSATEFLAQDIGVFQDSVEKEHLRLALRSLGAMSAKLKQNIYSLPTPAFPVDKITPPKPDPLARVRYSCVFWADHFCDGNKSKQGKYDFESEVPDGHLVQTFLEQHLLHWLEALCILNRLSGGMLQISMLKALFDRWPKTSKLKELVKDALRFILYHKNGIETTPLQLYSSALIFSPTKSMVRDQFKELESECLVQKTTIDELWSASIHTLEPRASITESIAFSYNGLWLASASVEGIIDLWDITTGQNKHTFKGDEFGYPVAFSPDGASLAAPSTKGVKLWDLATKDCKHIEMEIMPLDYTTLSVENLVFSPDGTQIAVCSGRRLLHRLDVYKGQWTWCVKDNDGEITSIAFSPDGKELVSASVIGGVKLWDATTGQYKRKWGDHNAIGRAVAFTLDGTKLALGLRDGGIKIWDYATGRCQQTFEGTHMIPRGVPFSPDGSLIASYSNGVGIQLRDVSTGNCTHNFKGHTSPVSSLAFSPDGAIVASASPFGTIKLWDRHVEQPLQSVQSLRGHYSRVTAIAYSALGNVIASASWDGMIMLWDKGTGRLKQTFGSHEDCVKSIAFNHEGTRLVTLSMSPSRLVRVWDTLKGQCLVSLPNPTDQMFQFDDESALVMSRDGKWLAATSYTQIKLWNLITGQLRCLDHHKGNISSLAFSPAGLELASGSLDKTVKLWDVALGVCIGTLVGHESPVHAIAYSPDRKCIVSSSGDKTLKVWNTTTGQCVRTISIGLASRRLSFSNFGNWLRTDAGTISSALLSLTPSEPADLIFKEFHGLGLSADRKWLTKDSEEWLWLPPDYRPVEFFIKGQKVVLGCESGQVLFLEFQESRESFI